MRALSKTYPLVLYGAGGATGRLIIEAALAKGVPVLLAGRSPASLSELADRHNLPIATAGIDDPSGLAALAARGSILLNAAGPFAATALPLAQAALAAGTGYLDVSGEVDSLIALQSLDPIARAASLPLIVGAGYGVAAGETLALHVARWVPGADTLRLGLDTQVGRRSPGAAQSTVAALRRGNYEIRGGLMRRTAFVDRPWTLDFGGEAFLFAGAPLAEAWASARSSGVGNVRAGIRTRRALLPMLRLAAGMAAIGPVGRMMARLAASSPSATSAASRPSTLFAEASAPEGRRAASVLRITTEGYAAAAEIAVMAALVLASAQPVGFHTPGSAFGADFLDGLTGARRTDVD